MHLQGILQNYSKDITLAIRVAYGSFDHILKNLKTIVSICIMREQIQFSKTSRRDFKSGIRI